MTGQLEVRNWSAVSLLLKCIVPGRAHEGWQLVLMAGYYDGGKGTPPPSHSVVLGEHPKTPGSFLSPLLPALHILAYFSVAGHGALENLPEWLVPLGLK